MKTDRMLKEIFSELSGREACPDLETICAYADNSLFFKERKLIEKHLLDCSFCFNSFVELTEELDKIKDLRTVPDSPVKNKSIKTGYFQRLIFLFSNLWKTYSSSWFGSFVLGSAVTVIIFMFFINKGTSTFFSPQTGNSVYSSVNYVLTDVSDKSMALSHYREGEKFLEHSMIDKAKEEFLLSVKFNPDQAEAHWYLGSIYEQEGNYKEAIKHWKRYISISPRVGSYKEAKGFLDKVKESDK